jgi:hypothetical protein
MRELISPSQSETLVILVAILVSLIGGAWSFKAHGLRAAMLVVGAAIALWPFWKLHNWLTRFDPQSNYFGLQSVKVLLLEAGLFVVLGALVGWSWRKVAAPELAQANEKSAAKVL